MSTRMSAIVRQADSFYSSELFAFCPKSDLVAVRLGDSPCMSNNRSLAVASGSTRADHGLTCQESPLAAELPVLRHVTRSYWALSSHQRQVGAEASDRARRMSCPG